MNAPIGRLFGLVLVLFALLVGFTSRWTVFEAEALRDNPNNRRELLAEQLIKRGIDPRRQRRACWPRSRALSQKRFGRRYPTGRCSPTRSAARRSTAAAPGSRTTTTTR